MNRLKSLIRGLFKHSFVRFAAVGGTATAVNYAVYATLVGCFDTNPSLAYVMAFCVSVICNYLLSSYFTFQVKPSWKRAGKFVIAHLINLGNELLLLQLWLWVGVNKFFAPVCVFAIAFPISFLMVRFALTGRKKVQTYTKMPDFKSGS